MTALKFYLGVWLLAAFSCLVCVAAFSTNSGKEKEEIGVALFLASWITLIVWCFR